MKASSLAAVLVVSLFAVACSDPEFEPITDAQVRALGITEGMAGNAAKLVGNCMPGPTRNPSCRHETLDAELWIIPECNMGSLAATASGSDCSVMLTDKTAASIEATVVNLKSGQCGATLAP